MKDQLSIEEVKSKITNYITGWYLHDNQTTDEQIYDIIKHQTGHKPLHELEDIRTYVNGQMTNHSSVIFFPGVILYDWIIVHDILDNITEKTIRRIWRKLQGIDRLRTTVENSYAVMKRLSDFTRDLCRSMHMSARFVRTKAFQKKYRPELVQCSLMERCITRRPNIMRDAHPEYDSLWSAVPVSTLINLQLTVVAMTEDVEGYTYVHNNILTEAERIERLAIAMDARRITELGFLNSNAILGSIGAMANVLGIGKEIQEMQEKDRPRWEAEMALQQAAVDKIEGWIKAIDAIHATGFVTPYSRMYHQFRHFETKELSLFGKRYGDARLFPIETRAIIFHDLHYHIQEFHNLYGTHE